MLVGNALSSRQPVSPLRRLVTGWSAESRAPLDIKRRGLRPLVDVARVFAMQLGYLDSANTRDRLIYAARALPDMSRTAENALEAYHYLAEFRFRRHLRMVERGETPSNGVDPASLNQTQRSMLEVAFTSVREVQTEVAHRYGVSPRA